jgi:hypothetical protein
MKKLFLGISAVAVLLAASCKKDETTTPVTPDTDTLLTGEITADRTLKTGNTYILDGVVYVKNGATLTIQEGVTVKAKPGKTALVVTRGSKINAVGTATKPIVFTSYKAVPDYGDWGGIVMLGKATTNASFNGQAGQGEIEGGVNNSNNDGVYGGSDDNDNSGKLKYVRIEWGGYPFLPDKELNSLTMGGVGRGTEIDYVMTSYGYDDAFEWFGGTVNCKHLISYKPLDDDFDCDFGFRGNIQFAIAIRDKDRADVSGSNGFEQDNDGSGSTTTPITAPVFSNVTIIGPKKDANTTIAGDFKRVAHLRRNTRTSIFNSILMGFPTGILVDGSKAADNLINGDMELKGIILAGMVNKALDTVGTTSTGLALTALFNTSGWNNEIQANNSDVQLTAPFAAGNGFNPAPAAGSPAASGASFSSAKLGGGFFTPTTYRGAAASSGDEWWTGWTNF